MLFAEAQELYDDMLEVGVAKECARKVLPMNSPSRIYMQGTLRSWMHYIQLREANGTQKEHQEIALACKAIFEQQFPAIAQALADIEAEKAYVVKEMRVFEVPEGYMLTPISPTKRGRFREWFKNLFTRNVFDLR